MRISSLVLVTLLLVGCGNRTTPPTGAEPVAAVASAPSPAQDADWRRHLDQGKAAAATGDLQRATSEFSAAVESTASFPSTHPARAESLAALAAMQSATGPVDAAEATWRRAIAACDAAFAPGDLN